MVEKLALSEAEKPFIYCIFADFIKLTIHSLDKHL